MSNIAEACYYYDYTWPKELWTGVMFYRGQRITIEEFNKWSANFKLDK
jgi:hypothetical protein